MEAEFIPYEQALALKELGFNEPCLGYYVGKDKEVYMSNEILSAPFQFRLESKTTFVAPTFSQVFRWFREKYELLNHLTTHLNPYGEDGVLEESYGYRIMFNKDGWKCDVWEELSFFDTYEEAELECLKKLIEIVKEKKWKKNL